MKSLKIHYMNKYPGGKIESSEERLDVYDHEGRHCVSLRKNGGGAWDDVSEANGLPHRHDLSPIPKQSRLYKEIEGKISKDDQYNDRVKKVSEYMEDGRVLSCEQLQKSGKMKFDSKQLEV